MNKLNFNHSTAQPPRLTHKRIQQEKLAIYFNPELMKRSDELNNVILNRILT